MNDQTHNPYEEVKYPSLTHVQTHPDRLATIATLFGMHPAAVKDCRVLELGCGDGMNLISMAYGLPGSEFFGIDSAGCAIKAGNEMIEALALKNVRLQQVNLMDFDAGAGTFDFIIAHGVYSWVPAPMRDRILAICGGCLAPNGVAYISYNTYPGGHLRDMVREMMRYHVRGAHDAGQKIAQGRALLKFLAGSKNEPDLYRMILEKEFEHAVEYSDAAFYHDDLNPLTQPVYFHRFMEHATEHGLQFLGDAMFNEMQPDDYTPATLAALGELDNDILAREQYLDFLMCRRFRRTLLCRREVSRDHKIQPEVITQFYAASDAQSVSPEPDIVSSATEELRTGQGASIRTNRPLAKAALLHLSRCWPQAVHFTDLLVAARKLAHEEPAQDAEAKEDAIALSDLLLRGYVANVLELHVWVPRLVTEVSENPLASPVARYHCQRKKRIATLRHTGIELSDDLSHNLLVLLDGTRDSAALVEALTALVLDGKASLLDRDKPVTEPDRVRAMIAGPLPLMLKEFARAALLVG
jgi:methyltransferase-like protein/2-polyprenyl-3-methyl-5-hydroxy-6-metoxy-1,4-benzoquinol methylase